MESALIIPENVLTKLNKNELFALEKYQGKPSLAVSIQVQFFELFLNGMSCEEIYRLNSRFAFGAIVRARIEGQWDMRKDAIVAHALDTVRQRVEQTQIAAINFNADLLAAAHKQFGDKFKKYIQTGDEAELGEIRIESLKQYKDAIEMWLKLTGQDAKTPKAAEVAPVGGPKIVTTERAPTSDEADALFKLLLAKEK